MLNLNFLSKNVHFSFLTQNIKNEIQFKPENVLMHAGDNVHVVDLWCTVVKVRDLKVIRGEILRC